MKGMRTTAPQTNKSDFSHGSLVGNILRLAGPMTLALLVNTTRENCSIVQKRINEHFILGRQRARIEYYVNSVFWVAPLTDSDKIDGMEVSLP